jgi:hypothetical protein
LCTTFKAAGRASAHSPDFPTCRRLLVVLKGDLLISAFISTGSPPA